MTQTMKVFTYQFKERKGTVEAKDKDAATNKVTDFLRVPYAQRHLVIIAERK